MEGVLRRAAEAEATVDIRSGYQVLGHGSARQVGSTDGNRSRHQRPRLAILAADTVSLLVVARSLIGIWFREIGATAPPEQSEGCGAACYTRYFRLRERLGDNDAVTRQVDVPS